MPQTKFYFNAFIPPSSVVTRIHPFKNDFQGLIYQQVEQKNDIVKIQTNDSTELGKFFIPKITDLYNPYVHFLSFFINN